MTLIMTYIYTLAACHQITIVWIKCGVWYRVGCIVEWVKCGVVWSGVGKVWYWVEWVKCGV